MLYERASALSKPTKRQWPDEWARENRVYAPHSGMPGPRDPSITNYMIPIGRAAASRRYRRVVAVLAAQSGKTEMLLDLIGQRLDQDPGSILYVGPSRQFVSERFEPRIMELLDQAPALASKVSRGKAMTRTRKTIGGVNLILGHGGSSAALKSDPFSMGLIDEADELLENVKHQGDPVTLVDRRGDSFADFVAVVVSTPSSGLAETETDAESGLTFWSATADCDSKVWSLYQQGTRHHWCWQCPQCSDWFVPRFSCLEIPKNATPASAQADAVLICPRNGCTIVEADKEGMNRHGTFIAPGQTVDADGNITGHPPDNPTASYWVSGLCSPFRTFGQRAAEFVEAQLSGDTHRVQVVMNASFGELWAPASGDALPWEEVAKLRLPTYSMGTVPAGALYLTASADVHKNRLNYVVRGWGARQTSWLIEAGELYGETDLEPVWGDLADLLGKSWGGLHIRRMFVDSGFRPGKRDEVPEHMVYNFCRRHHRQAFATKGFEHRDAPLSVKRIDVDLKGRSSKFGLDLVRLDTDFAKSWVIQRLRWPQDQPGAWHLPSDATDDYCKQVVSEARVRKQGGGYTWVQVNRSNHFLDCEAMAYMAAYMLGITRMSDEKAQYILQEREREGFNARPSKDGEEQKITEEKFAPDRWFGAAPGELRSHSQRGDY